eukprot:191901-Pelagomonas_calceolata.AAC.5
MLLQQYEEKACMNASQETTITKVTAIYHVPIEIRGKVGTQSDKKVGATTRVSACEQLHVRWPLCLRTYACHFR